MAVAAGEATVGLAIRARDLPEQEDPACRRVRRDVAMSGLALTAGSLLAGVSGTDEGRRRRLEPPDPADHRPAAGRVPVHRRRRAPARQAGPSRARRPRSGSPGSSGWQRPIRAADRRGPIRHDRLRQRALHVESRRGRSRLRPGSSSTTWTACLLIVVLTIGLLVHVYSIRLHEP